MENVIMTQELLLALNESRFAGFCLYGYYVRAQFAIGEIRNDVKMLQMSEW